MVCLIFEFDGEFTEIFKIKDKGQLKKRNSKDYPLAKIKLSIDTMLMS